MARFLTELDLCPHPSTDALWVLQNDLNYQSDLLIQGKEHLSSVEGIVHIPAGFVTDLASSGVKWCHREAVVHDWLYRVDSVPVVSKEMADKVFYEAMLSRGKRWWIRWGFYLAVKWFGKKSYHKKTVDWKGDAHDFWARRGE